MRFNGGIYGELFLGGSYVKVSQALHVDGTLQVVHVAGGQAMMDNFLGDVASGPPGSHNSNYGTGSLKNILVQYDYSFGTLARYPEDFWGNGPDIKVQLFGLYTKVRSADPDWDNQDKLKFGAKVIYSPLSWLQGSMRFDRVIPNMNTDPNADPTTQRVKALGQNFSVLSTRLTLRTSFVAPPAPAASPRCRSRTSSSSTQISARNRTTPASSRSPARCGSDSTRRFVLDEVLQSRGVERARSPLEDLPRAPHRLGSPPRACQSLDDENVTLHRQRTSRERASVPLECGER